MRCFYYLFPRGSNDTEKALAILKSIIERGLVLTPELIHFSEKLANGERSKPWSLMQKKISFTELSPDELTEHSSFFGAFSLEWEQTVLIEMGAVPVFYVPLQPSHIDANDGLAAAILSRVGEIQQLLERLKGLEDIINSSRNDSEPLQITRNGVPIKQTKCTVGGAADLLEMLKMDIQPIPALDGALRALSGYFYPVDNPCYTDLLGYYRQREWRILANARCNGVQITHEVTEKDSRALLAINHEFFGRAIDFRSGTALRVSGCQIFRSFRGEPIIKSVRRVICPSDAKSKVQKLLNSKGFDMEVASINEIS